jgi:hypothetical protein
LAIVAVVVVSAGYFVLWGSEDWAGKFLFIESRTIVEAEVLQGKWSILIDFPFYRYDVSTGRIEYYGNSFDLGKLLAVYGSLLAYRGAGGGTSSCLYPIYSTPCAACDGTSILYSIDKDGTVHITYENKQIVLSLNQHWQTENESIEHFEGAVVRFKQTTTIENLGYWKKANIRIHNSPTMFLIYSARLHIEEQRALPQQERTQQSNNSNNEEHLLFNRSTLPHCS